MTNRIPHGGIEGLAEAIIEQALEDYFYLLLYGYYPEMRFGGQLETMHSIREFLKSGWFTHIWPGENPPDGEDLIKAMDAMAVKAKNARFRVGGSYGSFFVYDRNDPDCELFEFDNKYDAIRFAAKKNGLKEWHQAVLEKYNR